MLKSFALLERILIGVKIQHFKLHFKKASKALKKSKIPFKALNSMKLHLYFKVSNTVLILKMYTSIVSKSFKF